MSHWQRNRLLRCTWLHLRCTGSGTISKIRRSRHKEHARGWKHLDCVLLQGSHLRMAKARIFVATGLSATLGIMPSRHLYVPAAIFLATAFCCVQAQPQKPAAQSVEARLAAQNALFEESWQTSLRLNPTRATSVGDYRYNDQLGDSSLAAIARQHDLDATYLAKIKAIDAKGFPEQDLISHDLFLRQAQQRVEDYDLKEYEMPISGMGGIHTSLADLPLSMPFDSTPSPEIQLSPGSRPSARPSNPVQ